MKFCYIYNIVFLSVVVTVEDEGEHLLGVLKNEDSIAHRVSKDVHQTFNAIFTALKIEKNFSNKTRNNLLISIHSQLRNISEHAYKNYYHIENASKLDDRNKTHEELFNLVDVIDDVLTAFLYTNLTDSNEADANSTSEERDMDETSDVVDNNLESSSNESSEVFKTILDELKGLTLFDLSGGVKIKHMLEEPYVNLKTWVPPENGTTPVDVLSGRRIFQSRKTTINAYPFIVSIHLMDEHLCAGSVISKDLILTAASCLYVANGNSYFGQNTHSFFVRAGSDYSRIHGFLLPVIVMYFHPLFNPDTLANNLVILRIRRHIYFTKTKKKIRRVNYSRAPKELPDGVTGITFLGWRERQIDDRYNSETLSFAIMNVYNHHQCKEAYFRKHNVTFKNFCAIYVQSEMGTCLKDIGSPALHGSTLVGVVTFTPTTCSSQDYHTPTVFLNIGQYVEWIDSVVGMKYSADTEQNIENKITSEDKDTKDSKRKKKNYSAEIMILKEILDDALGHDELTRNKPEAEYKSIVKTSSFPNLNEAETVQDKSPKMGYYGGNFKTDNYNFKLTDTIEPMVSLEMFGKKMTARNKNSFRRDYKDIEANYYELGEGKGEVLIFK